MDKREAITADNVGPVVSLLAWIMEAAVIIAVIVKFTLSSMITGKKNAEDIALFVATTFSIGFTVSMSLAVPNGIGRHEDSLSTSQLETLQKAVYSADILLILVSTTIQGSVLVLLHDITPVKIHRRAIYAVSGFSGVSYIAFIFTALFRCRPPRVWELLGNQCIDQISFWQVFAALNLVIESALVLVPVIIVWPLALKGKRKVVMVGCFAARLLVIAAFAMQLFQAHSLRPATDRTFNAWRYLLTTVILQAVSIITVCVPYIRRLFLSMESGMIQTGHFRLPSRHSADDEVPLEPVTMGKSNSNMGSSGEVTLEQPAAARLALSSSRR